MGVSNLHQINIPLFIPRFCVGCNSTAKYLYGRVFYVNACLGGDNWTGLDGHEVGVGGASRSRTGLNGFAGRGITALLSRLYRNSI